MQGPPAGHDTPSAVTDVSVGDNVGGLYFAGTARLVGRGVGAIVKAFDGALVRLVGSFEGAFEGGAANSLQVKDPPSSNTQESSTRSATSAIANLILFHPFIGLARARSLTVKPSASTL